MTCGYNSPSDCNSGPLGPSMAEMCGSPQFFVFMSILNELIRSNSIISGKCERVRPIETPDAEYDFVVIGGGGAGAVVAARLSENPDWKVLLLEAGPDEPIGGQMPLFSNNLHRTEVDWNFTTTNESYGCLSSNGHCEVRSGKMLGGGTSLNGMLYLWGNPKDYNNWAEEGNEGWTWEEVKEFYLKSEDNGEIERVGRKYHATGGPLAVERFPYTDPFANTLLDAAAKAGYKISEDLNGEQISGFAITQSNVKNGVRRSSARSYLWPARNRKNLHVSINSLGTKVIVKDNKAVGVEYHKDGLLHMVNVSGEVIVSAGTIKSPHLLLLSGIGPKEHLESMGVEVVKDLPGVGENLQDHVTYPLDFTVNEPDYYDNDYDVFAQYLINQTGPLSGIGFAPVVGVLNTKSANPEYPDLQLHYGPYTSACAPGNVGLLRSAEKRLISTRVVNLRPKSRGRISLASNHPSEHPAIWFNYLSDPSDIEVLVEGIERALALAETQTLRAFNFTLSLTPTEACSRYNFPSTEYWRCEIRQNMSPELHHGGSCKMGPSSDPMAVVDPRLRVHGIKGLRVADNSIMPQVISSNTAAPAVMIGERAADFIKKDWGLYSLNLNQ